MNKKHVIGYAATAILALGIGGASSGNAAAPVTVTKEVQGPERVVTKTVEGPERVVTKNVAPAECGTALDLASEFTMAVSKEHTAIGKAATKAGDDGDMVGMFTKMSAAVAEMRASTDDITPKMGPAASACRAAIK